MSDDLQLIDRHAGSRHAGALGEITQRHVDIVYSAAKRRVGDRHLAEDITQAVFVILVKNRRSFHSPASLTAWLLTTVRYAAANALKIERRRRRYEGLAGKAAVNGACSSNPSDVLVWQEVAAHLDDAVLGLSRPDREAVLLRFFENKSIRDIAGALDVSEAAASQRLSRAIDKLCTRLTRRAGMSALMPSVAGGLATLLVTHIARAATPALTQSIYATATAANSGAGAAGAVSIAKGAIEIMTWSKIKITVAVAAVAVIGVGSVVTLNRMLGQARNDAPPAIAPVPAQAPTTAPAVAEARLKNGVAVELHGVAEYPATGRKWWAADGSPLGRAPYHHVDNRATPWGMSDSNRKARGSKEPEVSREIAVRVNRKVDGQAEPATLRWDVRFASGSSWWPEVENEANKIIPNMHGLPIRLPGEMSKHATLRIDVAAGPWKTLFVAPAATGGSRRGDDGTFDLKVSEVNGESQFVFSRTGIKRGLDESILAIDTTGQSHPLVLKRSTSDGDDQTDTYHLPKPLASLKEVQFKQRPFDQWISCGGISLHPDQASKISIATSDEPLTAKGK